MDRSASLVRRVPMCFISENMLEVALGRANADFAPCETAGVAPVRAKPSEIEVGVSVRTPKFFGGAAPKSFSLRKFNRLTLSK